jgi:hypothetical protein
MALTPGFRTARSDEREFDRSGRHQLVVLSLQPEIRRA